MARSVSRLWEWDACSGRVCCPAAHRQGSEWAALPGSASASRPCCPAPLAWEVVSFCFLRPSGHAAGRPELAVWPRRGRRLPVGAAACWEPQALGGLPCPGLALASLLSPLAPGDHLPGVRPDLPAVGSVPCFSTRPSQPRGAPFNLLSVSHFGPLMGVPAGPLSPRKEPQVPGPAGRGAAPAPQREGQSWGVAGRPAT